MTTRRRPPVRRPVPPVPGRIVRQHDAPRRTPPARQLTTTLTATVPGSPVTNPNLTSARAYILTAASWNDLEEISGAIRDRRLVLGASTATGARVRLSGLRRSCLNGLTGTVRMVRDGRADVELDEQSTRALRDEPGSRYAVPVDATGYVLRRVPLAACVPTD
jgi:hypothetical protein